MAYTKKKEETKAKDNLDELEGSGNMGSPPEDEKTEGGGLVMENASVGLSAEIEQSPNCHDAVMAFASYLSTVKTFKCGTRGDSSKLATFANEFCYANKWDEASPDFPNNINYPE